MNSKHQIVIFSFFLLTCITIFVACKKDISEPLPPVDEKSMEQLIIASDFDFTTSKTVNISFNDALKAGGEAKYDIFIYNDETQTETITYTDEGGNQITDEINIFDDFNGLIATRVSSTGNFNLIVSIPDYINKFYVIKNELGLISSEIVLINGKSAVYNGPHLKSTNDDPVDILYGVNGTGNLFTINPSTGEMVVVDNMEQGSWTCAIDKINRKLYTIGRSSPYPLYKYDLDNTNDFELITNLGMGGPRLEYSVETGLLYFSRTSVLYTIDPTSGEVLTQQDIEGIHNHNGGDLKFGSDGTLYLASFSGLYRLEFGEGDVQAIRISAENLPFSPTSMTIDSNDELWLATNDNNGKLVVMDKVTGGWEYRFDPYEIAINDLTTLPLDVALIPEEDDDGDGIINFYDEYPEDADKAYDTYTPSIYGVGSLAYEDLWPGKGDYDFNDLVVNYQFITVANSSDLIVEIQCNFTVRHIGGSYKNGFGFIIPINQELIENVSGYNLTTGNISVDGKGLETDQEQTVIIVFDDAFANQDQELSIVIDLVEPINPELPGVPPYNPFIFRSENRGHEIHLPDQGPSDLVDALLFGTVEDNSNPGTGRYYKTTTNLPWAIHVIHNFRFPLEKQQINKGYMKFNEWAESSGTAYTDWYKDNPGYRDESFLNITD